MSAGWWRRDAAGLRLAVRVPQASVRLLQGSRSRDKLLAVDGVQQLPATIAGLAGQDS